MPGDTLDEAAISQFWPTVVALLLMAATSATLLLATPWGIDPVYTPLAHFLTLWPLTLLAILTYIASVKLDDEVREVPGR